MRPPTSEARRQPIALACLAILLAGCATFVPGADYPRTASTAFAQPTATRLGRQLVAQAVRHSEQSGFRLVPRGVDGLLLRTQLVRAAERSLDIQYFIFTEDETGKLLLDSILRAADRGVRVRILIDDTNSFGPASGQPIPPLWRPPAQEILAALNDHSNIDLRLFNPFVYRGNISVVRYADFTLNAPRVNHRMHNKLMVVDGAFAIVGGRNVADEYFDAGSPAIRFGDFDVAATGPVVPQLAASFDAFWNCALSVPQKALAPLALAPPSLSDARAELEANRDGIDMREIERKMNRGDPLNGLLEGRLPWVWARAKVVVDPPEKAETASGQRLSSPTVRELMGTLAEVSGAVDIVTPYFVPGERGLSLLKQLRQRNVRVRILTNSLASTDEPAVHGAHGKHRQSLVDAGVELYEIRAIPGQIGAGSGPHGSGGASDAPFALHANVFDRKRVFIGSANFDRRSFQLNTEVGLMIDSPELAQQIVARFDQFAALPNSYRLVLDRDGPRGPRLRWRTILDGKSSIPTKTQMPRCHVASKPDFIRCCRSTNFSDATARIEQKEGSSWRAGQRPRGAR
jgi:cardiolipin synthase C